MRPATCDTILFGSGGSTGVLPEEADGNVSVVPREVSVDWTAVWPRVSEGAIVSELIAEREARAIGQSGPRQPRRSDSRASRSATCVTPERHWRSGTERIRSSWRLIPVATPRFSLSFGIFTGSRGEAWLQPPSPSAFSDFASRVVAKADPGWEAFEQTDVSPPDGGDRPSSAGAGGEPNTPIVEADVYSLRTRRDGSTAVDGQHVIDEFGAPVPSYPVMR
jgi:hypothetical protein